MNFDDQDSWCDGMGTIPLPMLIIFLLVGIVRSIFGGTKKRSDQRPWVTGKGYQD